MKKAPMNNQSQDTGHFDQDQAVFLINRLLVKKGWSFRELAHKIGRDPSVTTQTLNRPPETRRKLINKTANQIAVALGFDDIIDLIEKEGRLYYQGQEEYNNTSMASEPTAEIISPEKALLNRVKKVFEELNDIQQLLLIQK
jgi:lambda repressor-like predicted transcriptional regulator